MAPSSKSKVSAHQPETLFDIELLKDEVRVIDWLQEIANEIKSLGFTVERNVKNVANGNLDIYIPEKKVAFEFNGLFWHSEQAGKGKWYHFAKFKSCKEQGIQLIQIWEDEWLRNPNQVKSMIAHKLGVSKQGKVYARSTEIVILPVEESFAFLNVNHIQGNVDGGIRLGLKEKGENGRLVAVMLLKREAGTEGKVLNLLRFATSATVVGGFTKLLKYAEQNYGAESVVTFSDNSVSDGGLYENNGFINVKIIDPDYKYVAKGERIHKFNYRLKRFRDDPELIWDETLSERQLALLNNLPRVWDTGKVKWEKQF